MGGLTNDKDGDGDDVVGRPVHLARSASVVVRLGICSGEDFQKRERQEMVRSCRRQGRRGSTANPAPPTTKDDLTWTRSSGDAKRGQALSVSICRTRAQLRRGDKAVRRAEGGARSSPASPSLRTQTRQIDSLDPAGVDHGCEKLRGKDGEGEKSRGWGVCRRDKEGVLSRARVDASSRLSGALEKGQR